MKYLSLFSGIGGFEIGIQKAHESICNVDGSEDGGGEENSSYDERKRFLAKERKNFSTKERSTCECSPDGIDERPLCIGYSEINKYADEIYKKHFNHKNYGDITKINVQELPDFELLVGGFPCQAFSIAGKRRGFDDTRGTLFFDVARILKEKQPRNFVLENVKGLLSHDNGRTFKIIITTLTELGYCVEWQVLNAKNFGVLQNRERVFIVGHLGGIPERKVFPITNSTGKDIIQLNKPKHSNDRVYAEEGISPTLNTMQVGNRQPFVLNQQTRSADRPSLKYSSGGSGLLVKKDEAFCLPTTGGSGQFVLGTRIRRLTPLECERLMGYPDGWTEGLSDTQRYKCLGNGVVSNVVEEVVRRLYE